MLGWFWGALATISSQTEKHSQPSNQTYQTGPPINPHDKVQFSILEIFVWEFVHVPLSLCAQFIMVIVRGKCRMCCYLKTQKGNMLTQWNSVNFLLLLLFFFSFWFTKQRHFALQWHTKQHTIQSLQMRLHTSYIIYFFLLSLVLLRSLAHTHTLNPHTIFGQYLGKFHI